MEPDQLRETLDFHLSVDSWLGYLIQKKHRLWKESCPLNVFIFQNKNLSNCLRSLMLMINDWLLFYLLSRQVARTAIIKIHKDKSWFFNNVNEHGCL